MRVVLKLFSILLVTLPITCWPASEINLARSQLAVLAQNLEIASSDKKIEFARIALTQMYITYEFELNHSYNERPGELKSKTKLNRWRYATNHYLREIENALNQILSGSDYGFFVNQQDKIVFFVSGETLMISGPNNKADSLMESNIINLFCDLFDCQDHLTKDEEKYFENIQPIVNGYWLMNKKHKADFYINNGIIFRFESLNNRKAKQNWSLHLTQDLLLLLKTLNFIKTKDYIIDWASISISSNPFQVDSIKLTINKKRDFIYVTLPTLSKSTEIFQLMKPWLQQYQLNSAHVDKAIIVHSEQYYKEI